MWVMGEELVLELCVRGYHVYKDIWEAAIDEELQCERKTRNTKDIHHSCEKRWHGGWTSTGKNLSTSFDFSTKRKHCCVSSRRRYSADLPQGGLEVPCVLRFTGQSSDVQKLNKLIKPSKNWLSTYFRTYTVIFKLSSLDGHAYTGISSFFKITPKYVWRYYILACNELWHDGYILK